MRLSLSIYRQGHTKQNSWPLLMALNMNRNYLLLKFHKYDHY
jgi:hypothetical protein